MTGEGRVEETDLEGDGLGTEVEKNVISKKNKLEDKGDWKEGDRNIEGDQAQGGEGKKCHKGHVQKKKEKPRSKTRKRM